MKKKKMKKKSNKLNYILPYFFLKLKSKLKESTNKPKEN